MKELEWKKGKVIRTYGIKHILKICEDYVEELYDKKDHSQNIR